MAAKQPAPEAKPAADAAEVKAIRAAEPAPAPEPTRAQLLTMGQAQKDT